MSRLRWGLIGLAAACLSPSQSAAATNWARAYAPREWAFPQDHGAHPEYQTEWWYLTGNLASSAGRRFGFQLTFFRHGLVFDSSTRAGPADRRASAWRLRDVHFAHFALTDVEGNRFYDFERADRGALGRAGAMTNQLQVWNGPWTLRQTGSDPFACAFRAAADGVALDLAAVAEKPLVLQGDRGLSAKSDDPGNASHYYSFTRLATTGHVTIGSESFDVTGLSWMDREFSTSALAAGQVGWDWFSIQLDSDEEAMLYVMRRSDGSHDPNSAATWIDANGATHRLRADDFTLEILDHWTSPETGTIYPNGWRIVVPAWELDLSITPLIAQQELVLSALGPLTYWEGACQVAGRRAGAPVAGWGYTELAGYGTDVGRAMRGGAR